MSLLIHGKAENLVAPTGGGGKSAKRSQSAHSKMFKAHESLLGGMNSNVAC